MVQTIVGRAGLACCDVQYVVLLYWGSFSDYYIYKYLMVLFDPFYMRTQFPRIDDASSSTQLRLLLLLGWRDVGQHRYVLPIHSHRHSKQSSG